MTYREATPNDIEKIAALHAQSWQLHYQGILKEEFLSQAVEENRLEVWRSRLQNPAENQYILLAEDAGVLCGFACVFADEDPVWGALLDNLHISAHRKGEGIGTMLLRLAAQWAVQRRPSTNFYLWVYEDNRNARKFYEGLGAVNQEMVSTENPGGGSANVCRYVWTDVKALIERKPEH
jgi:GNAT superfamily N-acetyltransferase